MALGLVASPKKVCSTKCAKQRGFDYSSRAHLHLHTLQARRDAQGRRKRTKLSRKLRLIKSKDNQGQAGGRKTGRGGWPRRVTWLACNQSVFKFTKLLKKLTIRQRLIRLAGKGRRD